MKFSDLYSCKTDACITLARLKRESVEVFAHKNDR